MSSINQSWDPPMEGQDEFNLLYVAGTYHNYGTLCYAGSCSMMDEYGTGGVSMFDTWHIFGDPSARVVGTTAPPTGMRVSPGGGLISEGANGGPFTPDQLVYTLTNHEAYPIDFTVSESASWLDLSATSGTIGTKGETYVTVSINASASSLPNGTYLADVDFVNITNHDGDCTRTSQLTVGVPVIVYEWNLDTNPGWSTEGEWAFGVPTGGGGTSFGNPDPTSGATGSNVFGINLNGDYSTAIGGPYLLTTGPIDCSNLAQVSLHFQRWLNSDYQAYVYQTIEVSDDGSTWTEIWDNGSSTVADGSWSEQVHDIAAIADGQSTVYVRWGHRVGQSGAWAYSGWNVDDVQIYGVQPSETVSAGITCVPSSGTLPFSVQITVAMSNLVNEARSAAGRIDLALGNGGTVNAWKAGWTNLSPHETYSTFWGQNFPAVGALLGVNTFTMVVEDVTPAPFNQPPYSPSGDTDLDDCMVTANSP
jgi:hypothetical protein